MTVTFRCGHSVDLPRDVASAPMCGCGERIVSSVSGAIPRFRGACTGPHAETVTMPAATERFSPEALRLKERV